MISACMAQRNQFSGFIRSTQGWSGLLYLVDPEKSAIAVGDVFPITREGSELQGLDPKREIACKMKHETPAEQQR